jgi:hypothetical protein
MAWLALPASGELVGPTGGGLGLVGPGDAVVVVVVDPVGGGGPVVVVAVVVVPVVLVVLVVVAPDPTTIVPVMKVCRSQWKVYVPGVLNVQLPLQPGLSGLWGSGGTAPVLCPAVCVHELGAGPVPKSALCMVEPDGYENVTVPPVAMFTVLPPPAASH